jgi:hypothetical protein
VPLSALDSKDSSRRLQLGPFRTEMVRDLVASPKQASEIAGEVSEPRLGSTLDDDSVYLG